MSVDGSISYGGSIQSAGGWLSAFGTGGFEGEPPLLEGAVQPSTLFLAEPAMRRTRNKLFAYQSQVAHCPQSPP